MDEFQVDISEGYNLYEAIQTSFATYTSNLKNLFDVINDVNGSNEWGGNDLKEAFIEACNTHLKQFMESSTDIEILNEYMKEKFENLKEIEDAFAKCGVK